MFDGRVGRREDIRPGGSWGLVSAVEGGSEAGVFAVTSGGGPFLTLCPNLRWLVSGVAPMLLPADASIVAIAKQSTLSEAMSVLGRAEGAGGAMLIQPDHYSVKHTSPSGSGKKKEW